MVLSPGVEGVVLKPTLYDSRHLCLPEFLVLYKKLWQKGSVGRNTCNWAWWPKFDHWVIPRHSGRREQTLACMMSSDLHVLDMAQMPTCAHSHTHSTPPTQLKRTVLNAVSLTCCSLSLLNLLWVWVMKGMCYKQASRGFWGWAASLACMGWALCRQERVPHSGDLVPESICRSDVWPRCWLAE